MNSLEIEATKERTASVMPKKSIWHRIGEYFDAMARQKDCPPSLDGFDRYMGPDDLPGVWRNYAWFYRAGQL